MVWVRSEYAGELAVVSAWLAALLPWNITYSTFSGTGSVLFVRFPFGQVRYAFGIPMAEAATVDTTVGALIRQWSYAPAEAYAVWTVGAVVVAGAVILSLLLYRNEERVEERIDPVRVMGGLLSLAALVLTVATWLLWTGGFPGVPIPVGVVLLFVLGGMLLIVERE